MKQLSLQKRAKNLPSIPCTKIFWWNREEDMPIITYREALNAALDEEMARDETVFLIGEEVGEYNGAYKVSKGLLDKYGPRRVIDTPITELGFTGLGVGAAMAGLRPVVEWMTHNFSLLALDQVVNNAAKMRYMSGGQFKLPIVFRGPNGPAEYLSAQHSQALQTYWAHVPGLKVVAPATPYDAKGLLKSAIRDDNPVVVLEGELMYAWKGEVPEGEYLVPIGKADVKRSGSDVTVVTYSKPLKVVQEAAEILAQEKIEIEIIDLRSLRPLDEETVYQSVRKTNRVVVVDESWPVASVGSYVAWLISKNCFDVLDAQVELVSSEDVPMPYNHRLELAA
ncbi:MAG: pyruvate dehydrogenase complex E1 component subunit beta, partial [Spirochaetales bacterium]|nr:pyruvate dehydrogenase complex E1 component subunit beta [Spirochaetales bacterium]